MPRRSSIKICALNIILHPHNEQLYIGLLKKIFISKHVVKLKAEHAGMLGALSQTRYSDLTVMIGKIYKFVNVSPPWFDVDKNEPILDENGIAVHLVSKQQKSNLKEATFIFIPSMHRMFIDIKTMSINVARDIIDELCASVEIIDEFGDVSVTIETSQEGVDRILEYQWLKMIHVRLTKPNNEGLNRYTESILEEMQEQNVEGIQHVLSTRDKDGIRPNEKTKEYMYAATSIGSVNVRAYDENKKTIEMSTDEYPQTYTKYYSSTEESYFRAFVNGAIEMAYRLLGIRKR